MSSKKQTTFLSLLIWLCVTTFYCYQSILRILPIVIMPDIMNKYNIGATQFGSFAGIYYIGYVVAHIPIAILLSHFSTKIILPICIIFTTIGIAPIVYSDSWWIVIVGRIFTGIGSAASAVGALQIFRLLYPTKFSRMLGVMIATSLPIAVYANNFLSGVVSSVGMNVTINMLLYPGIALSILAYFLLPSSLSGTSHNSVFSDIKSVICNYRLLLTSLCAGLMVGPMEGFADAWASGFIMSVYNLEKIVADSITLSVLLGMGIGCIVLPYIAEKTKIFLGTTIISGIVMIICFVYMMSGIADANSLYYTCIIVGIFSAYQVVIIPKVVTYVSEERGAMAAAVVNMIVMAFGWIFHNSIGITLDYLWTGEMVDGIKFYNADIFITSISIIPIAITIAVIGLISIEIVNIIHARIIKKHSDT